MGTALLGTPAPPGASHVIQPLRKAHILAPQNTNNKAECEHGLCLHLKGTFLTFECAKTLRCGIFMGLGKHTARPCWVAWSGRPVTWKAHRVHGWQGCSSSVCPSTSNHHDITKGGLFGARCFGSSQQASTNIRLQMHISIVQIAA